MTSILDVRVVVPMLAIGVEAPVPWCEDEQCRARMVATDDAPSHPVQVTMAWREGRHLLTCTGCGMAVNFRRAEG